MVKIKFKINGECHTVGCEISSEVTLLDYIRNHAELRGTKYMCREGGCGACIVSVVRPNVDTPQSVNSCLVSVTSCQDWKITTIEKLGNRNVGYHVLQKTLAENNGTQCGYCSPGWIMSMYSLTKSKKQLSKLEIEKSFASNICRCTGYRPILETFKTFADSVNNNIEDIEDINKCSMKDKENNSHFNDWCITTDDDLDPSNIIEIQLADDKKWFKVENVTDIFKVLNEEQHIADSYMLVCGNTAKGAYPDINSDPRIFIDLSDVKELKGYTIDQNLIIGAGSTLTELLDIFEQVSDDEYFSYVKILTEHIQNVAHMAVRNIGSIAGNLMIKHQYKSFTSDIFLLFETVGAFITIKTSPSTTIVVSMTDFLKLNMRMSVIYNIMLPPLNNFYNLVTFKIMPRAQNAHGIVNAGFLFKMNEHKNKVTNAIIVYGGLSPDFIHAKQTERLLNGKDLFMNETLQLAIKSLREELIVTEMPPEPSAEFRWNLAINLFYKALLSLCPNNLLDSGFTSGKIKLRQSRPVSTAKQTFDSDMKLWPLNQPVQKLEALIQCSGEALYAEDIPSIPNEVFASFVLSTISTGNIASIDPSEALKTAGVLNFYSKADIPGLNSFSPKGVQSITADEEVFCDGKVKYFNQPIGIVVAVTRALAEKAVKLVKVTYSDVTKPVLDVKVASKITSRNVIVQTNDASEKGTDVAKVIKNTNAIYGQYHFTMENLVCLTKPADEAIEVHASSQFIDGIQVMMAKFLDIGCNSVDVYTRRVGGGYGIKLTRIIQVALACGLVTQKLNRPCRFIQPLSTTMRSVGKRFSCIADFEVAVNSLGAIQYLNYNVHEDNGYTINETISIVCADFHSHLYDTSRWNYKCYDTLTDTAKNTWCRCPGSLESSAMIELIMEQISYEMSLDPLQVRMANLDNTKYSIIKEYIEIIKKEAQYEERRGFVDDFNKKNKWMKRGLRFSLLRYTPGQNQVLEVNISIAHGDGTVSVSHGGIEMGQGINTKAAQICAYLLKIPLGKVKVKPPNTTIVPNSIFTAASATSQNIGVGIQRACEQLLERINPIRIELGDPTWEELINHAYDLGIDLQGHGFVTFTDVQDYDLFGATLTEVQLDVLTGEFEILRVDILQDVGRSVNPELDIGQVEGAFIMGLGYWTCEDLVYDKNTGELLSNRTWNYYVPMARDIPQDFRVYLKKKSYSSDPWFGAKAAGEPPACMSIGITFALREAIAAARLDRCIPRTEWFTIDGPFTIEKILMALATKTEDFKFQDRKE